MRARFQIPLSIRACDFPARGLPMIFLTSRRGARIALTSSARAIKARALRSRRVVLHADPHYYGPLGLPLTSARLRTRLIRAVFADEAGQTGLPCSVIRPCARASLRTPRGPAVPNPEPGLADMAFAVTRAARLPGCICDEAAIPARALAPSKGALDTPLSPTPLDDEPGPAPGAPAPTGTGLPPGLIQLARRNTAISLRGAGGDQPPQHHERGKPEEEGSHQLEHLLGHDHPFVLQDVARPL
jgi:hypothetical protein